LLARGAPVAGDAPVKRALGVVAGAHTVRIVRVDEAVSVVVDAVAALVDVLLTGRDHGAAAGARRAARGAARRAARSAARRAAHHLRPLAAVAAVARATGDATAARRLALPARARSGAGSLGRHLHLAVAT